MEGPMIPRTARRLRARKQRWCVLFGTVALGAATLGIAGFATPASADDPHRDTIAVECSSGIVTQGDVSTSSMVVARIPSSALTDVPGGCVTR